MLDDAGAQAWIVVTIYSHVYARMQATLAWEQTCGDTLDVAKDSLGTNGSLSLTLVRHPRHEGDRQAVILANVVSVSPNPFGTRFDSSRQHRNDPEQRRDNHTTSSSSSSTDALCAVINFFKYATQMSRKASAKDVRDKLQNVPGLASCSCCTSVCASAELSKSCIPCSNERICAAVAALR